MKLSSPSSSHLRRRICPLFFASFSTEIKAPPAPARSPSRRLIYLQSVLNEVKALSKNPKNYSSLTTLDSLLSKTYLLDSASSLILIDYLSQIKKLGRSKTLLSHLKSSGKVSDSFLYSLVFDFLVKDGTINDVENVWADIWGSVKRFSFSNYVISVCKFGGVDEIKDVYDRILMGVESVLERQSYTALTGALCNVNEGLLAKEIVNQMYDKGMKVDNWTYFVMFQCFCRNGDFVEADFALRKLIKNGFTIDVSIYGTFLHALCKSGKYREANKLFQKLIKRSFRNSVLLKEGRRVIFQLNCDGVVPEIMAYESYFCALCNAGKLDDAEALLKKMVKGRILPEICVYGSFIKALFRAGRHEDAMKFFNVQRKKGLVRVDEIGRYMIMGLCEKGKSDEALRVFNEVSMVNAFVNDPNVCSLILDSYWKQSRVAEAEIFFKRLQLQEGGYGRTSAIMVNGYCSHGDVSNALKVFDEMLKRKMVVNGALYERVIRVLCDSGRVDEAFEYFNDMIETGHFLFCKRWRSVFKSMFRMDEHDDLETIKN